jgi:hypothetical protein
VVLLSAPAEVLLERIASRTTSDFGKTPVEREKILRDVAAIEPLLRRRATVEVDARAPLAAAVEAVLAVAESPAGAVGAGRTQKPRRAPGRG